MQYQTAHQSYLNAAETKNSAEQIILLYEATINYVKQAKFAIKNQDHNSHYHNIDKAMKLLRGLRVALDFSACQEVASSMDKYYAAIEALLVSAQCNENETLCDAVIENLKTIKTSWEDINLIITNSTPNNITDQPAASNYLI